MSEKCPFSPDEEERKEIFVGLLVDITKNQDTRFLVDVWSPMVELAGFNREELMKEARKRLEQHE